EEQQFNRLFSAQIGTKPDEKPAEIKVQGHITGILVAPDGTWGAVQSAPTPLVDDSLTSNRINIVDLATGKVKRVIETPGKLGDFEISPNGQSLSMIAAVDAHDPAETTLHLVDVATGAFRALNADAPEAVVDTEWMAD